MLNDHRVGEGDVESVLDDGGANEYVVFVAHKAQQHALQLLLAHLAVADSDAALGDKLLNPGGAREDRIDAVVHEIDLPASGELLFDSSTDEFRIEVRNHGVNRRTILGRCFNYAHVADA